MKRPLIRRIVQMWVNRGPWGFCVTAGQKVGEQLGLRQRSDSVTVYGRAPSGDGGKHPFDLEHGTDTSGLIWGEDVPTGGRRDLWSTAYYGIWPSVFAEVMAGLELEWSRFSFVDLGSGKGRALLLASQFPFRRIIGVDLSPQLNEIAAANVTKFAAPWQRCRDIEIVLGDASVFQLPKGATVLFLFNPFLAPVLKKVLRNVKRSLEQESREFYLVYVNPKFEKLVTKYAPEFVMLWERTLRFSEQDALADRFGSDEERAVVYRWAPMV